MPVTANHIVISIPIRTNQMAKLYSLKHESADRPAGTVHGREAIRLKQKYGKSSAKPNSISDFAETEYLRRSQRYGFIVPRGNIGVRPATRADAYGFLTARRAVVRWAFAMFGEYISYFCIGRPVGKRPVAGVGLAGVCLAWRLEGVPRGRYACVACCPFGFCAQDVAALPARKREGERPTKGPTGSEPEEV